MEEKGLINQAMLRIVPPLLACCVLGYSNERIPFRFISAEMR